jgi:hypothetical protein
MVGLRLIATSREPLGVPGLPLAVELAAARLRSHTLATLAERFDDRFRLLTVGARTALPRQQTLRAVVDWSYDLLFEDERRLFARLSVFGRDVRFIQLRTLWQYGLYEEAIACSFNPSVSADVMAGQAAVARRLGDLARARAEGFVALAQQRARNLSYGSLTSFHRRAGVAALAARLRVAQRRLGDDGRRGPVRHLPEALDATFYEPEVAASDFLAAVDLSATSA